MAWVRVGPERERLVNLDGFVHIQLVACDVLPGGGPGGTWAVEGLMRDRSSARLLEGSRAACQSLLDEVAQAVWAIGVGDVGQATGAGGVHPEAVQGPNPSS